jgi:hypothetical protein
MDRQTKLIITLRNFANAPNMWQQAYTQAMETAETAPPENTAGTYRWTWAEGIRSS